jgi:flagellin-specific chaperone FliS
MSHLNPSPDTTRHYFRMMLESQKDQLPSPTVIGLLYAELIRSLDRLIAALTEAPEARADAGNDDAEIAQSILTALAESVDFERAGSLAPLLSSLYERAGEQLAASLTGDDIGKLRDMRTAISDIAYSWQVLAD